MNPSLTLEGESLSNYNSKSRRYKVRHTFLETGSTFRMLACLVLFCFVLFDRICPGDRSISLCRNDPHLVTTELCESGLVHVTNRMWRKWLCDFQGLPKERHCSFSPWSLSSHSVGSWPPCHKDAQGLRWRGPHTEKLMGASVAGIGSPTMWVSHLGNRSSSDLQMTTDPASIWLWSWERPWARTAHAAISWLTKTTIDDYYQYILGWFLSIG